MVAVAPALAWAAVNHQASAYIATWDLTPGAPQAPLSQRIVVAASNYAIRYLPLVPVLLLLCLPLPVVFLGRRLARSTHVRTMLNQSWLWATLGLVAGILVVWREVSLRDASQLVVLEAARWVAGCLCAAALINTYGVLTATGRRQAAVWGLLGVWGASLLAGTHGLVLALLALEAWMVTQRSACAGAA